MSESRDAAPEVIPVPTGLALSALSPAFRERPHDVLDELRTREPVHRDRQFDRVMLTRYEDVAAVVGDRAMQVDPRKSRPGSFARLSQGVNENYRPSMLNMDDPDHKRLRGLVAQGFNLRSVEAMRPQIEAIANVLLDALASKPGFDVIEEYAGPLPDDDCLVRAAEVMDQLTRQIVIQQCSHRYLQGRDLARIARAVRAQAVAAALRLVLRIKTEVHQRVVAERRAHQDVTPMPAVAA